MKNIRVADRRWAEQNRRSASPRTSCRLLGDPEQLSKDGRDDGEPLGLARTRNQSEPTIEDCWEVEQRAVLTLLFFALTWEVVGIAASIGTLLAAGKFILVWPNMSNRLLLWTACCVPILMVYGASGTLRAFLKPGLRSISLTARCARITALNGKAFELPWDELVRLDVWAGAVVHFRMGSGQSLRISFAGIAPRSRRVLLSRIRILGDLVLKRKQGYHELLIPRFPQV